jgi:O-antigen/teichoic acid export membrane protein
MHLWACRGQPALKRSAPAWRRGLIASRLARNTVVTVYGQFINLGLQLAAVPIFVSQWGLHDYGAWLLLFTIPQLLVMSDLGFASAGGNVVTSVVAQGDKPGAAHLFATLRSFTLLVGCVIVCLAIAIIELGFPQLFEFSGFISGWDSTLLVCMLASLGLLMQTNTVTLAGYKASDAIALGASIFHTFSLVEGVAALVVVAAGGGPLAVGFAYLLVRATGTVVLLTVLRSHAPWLVADGAGIDRAALRLFAWPALASFTLPAANAMAIQGSVMVIAAVSGNAALPAFTTVRTLSRAALQFALAFNVASMPRFTVASATGDTRRMDHLVLLNLVTVAAMLLPAMVILLVGGLPFIGFWTNGSIIPSGQLLAILAITMVFNGIWMAISNLMLAMNKQSEFAYVFVAVAAASNGLGFVLSQAWGANGMAAAILLADILMVLWVLFRAHRLGIFMPARLASLGREEFHNLLSTFRHRGKKS